MDNVYWSASPSGIVNITPNGNNATVSRVGPGSFVLTATVVNSCGQNGGVSKQIGGGQPTPTILPYGPVCDGDPFPLSAVPDPSATSHHWIARVGASEIPLSETGYWSVLAPYNALYVELFITNHCGTAYKKKILAHTICQNSSTLNISPNPAMSNITVTMQQPNTPESEYHKENLAQPNSKNDLIRSLYIYDSRGTLKIKKIIGGEGVSRVQVDISSLVPGIYIVQTQNKQGTMQGKLIIQR